MASAPITVPFEELQSSPTGGMGADGFAGTRLLVCDWADKFTLMSQLKGGTLSGTYYAPHGFPGFDSSRVDSITFAPFDERVLADGADTTTATYAKALLTVNYRTGLTADPSNPDSPLFQESIEPFAEFLTLPAAGFKWGSTTGDALKDEEAPGKLFKGLNWVYTLPSVVTIPDAVFDLVGKVNDSAIVSISLGRTFAAETLLYNPPLLRRDVTTDGTSLSWNLQYRFGHKPQGWNRFWRASTQTWDRIYNASGPADPYETGDFTALVG